MEDQVNSSANGVRQLFHRAHEVATPFVAVRHTFRCCMDHRNNSQLH